VHPYEKTKERKNPSCFSCPYVLVSAVKEETYACLALSLVPGLGMRCLNQLVPQYQKLKELLRSPPGQVALCFLSREMRTFISSGEARRAADQAIQDSSRQGIRIFSVFDKEYPHLLKQIFDPPAILYGCGNLEVLCRPSVAVVGSRRCSVYGKEVTRKITREVSALLKGEGRPSLSWAMASMLSTSKKSSIVPGDC